MDANYQAKDKMPRTKALAWVGLGLVALMSLAPLALEPFPREFISAWSSPLARLATKALVIGCMLLVVGYRAWVDRARNGQPIQMAFYLLCLAGLMTAFHWYLVDTGHLRRDQATGAIVNLAEKWQRKVYLDAVNFQSSSTPHVFRPLPYGWTRSIELITHDWRFSCVAYRWFFTYWFLWASYRFVRIFRDHSQAWLTLLVMSVLYPFSIYYYLGQLTDPVSHALFVLALIYLIFDSGWLLAFALFLGIFAKETVVIVIPAYLACYWKNGWSALAKAFAFGLVCTLAFLACRVPVGWHPNWQSINDDHQTMLWINLGLQRPPYRLAAPFYQLYLQPFLFLIVFLPFIYRTWKDTEPPLKALFLTLTPLLLLSNLCFGWMYESRNFVPLLPLLVTMAQRPPRSNDEGNLAVA
jgi:hypothetical protein